MDYSMKEMAERFGVTEHTLRYYTDQGLLPCRREGGGRRVFTEESLNWMRGIQCLKGCGASLEDIRAYCRLCLQEESEENLRARYAIIRKQRSQAYRRLAEAKATVAYMEAKAAHYEAILAGLAPDDTNPKTWTPRPAPSTAPKSRPGNGPLSGRRPFLRLFVFPRHTKQRNFVRFPPCGFGKSAL